MATGFIVEVRCPTTATEGEYVSASLTVRNTGSEGIIYGYIENGPWSPGKISVKYGGVEYGPWNPGDPGLLIPSGSPVPYGDTITIDLQIKFHSPGIYSVIFEAGHQNPDETFSKDDSRVVDVDVSGPLWIDLQASPTSGYAPLAVKFIVNWEGGSPPVDFVINYGDGSPPDRADDVYGYCPIFYHTYESPGTYTASVTATDSAGSTVSDSVTITVERQVTEYNLTVSSAGNGQVRVYVNGVLRDIVRESKTFTVREDDWVSLDAEPDEGYQFDYFRVDGGTIYVNPYDFYPSHDMTVVAYFKRGPPPALSCGLTAFPTSGQAPLQVTFTCTASGGGTPYTYKIDFGDGSSDQRITTRDMAEFTHIYSKEGTYHVKMTVTDYYNQTCTKTTEINVSEAPPTELMCGLNASSTSGTAPLSVIFTCTATGGEPPYKYTMNYGDGISESKTTSQVSTSFSHTYGEQGTYKATLVVEDSAEQTCSRNIEITVQAPPPPPPPPPECEEGETKCIGPDLYICQDGQWVLKEKNSPECQAPPPAIDWTKILPIALIAVAGIVVVSELIE